MSYKKEFDIASKSFDFAKDLEYGQTGEESILNFYNSVIQGSAEIKTDRYRNGRMVVETNQNPKNKVDELGQRIWDLSGINVTTAKWWIYIYCLNHSIVVVSVERLKKYLRSHKDKFNEQNKVIFAQNSDNPAKGFLIEPHDVIKMLYSNEYD